MKQNNTSKEYRYGEPVKPTRKPFKDELCHVIGEITTGESRVVVVKSSTGLMWGHSPQNLNRII